MATWRLRFRLLPVRQTATGAGIVPARGRLALGIGAAIFLLLSAGPAWAQMPVVPSQSQNPKNSEAVSAVNAAVAVTLTPTTATRARLTGATARCSAGSASLSVTDGGTTVWSSDSAFIGTTTKSVTWIPPYTSGMNLALVVTLGACGAGNTGTLDVQADIY